jgi:RHS repeat-associated protein
VWFGGRLVQKGGTSVAAPDRLGSIGRYLPYGEERTGQSGNPANGNEKFATYTRDGVTGLDYADQRWYAQGQGRFLTSDPYQASAGPGDPASWNRYAYVGGDPIGFVDPTGLDQVVVDQFLGGQIQCQYLVDREGTRTLIGCTGMGFTVRLGEGPPVTRNPADSRNARRFEAFNSRMQRALEEALQALPQNCWEAFANVPGLNLQQFPSTASQLIFWDGTTNGSLFAGEVFGPSNAAALQTLAQLLGGDQAVTLFANDRSVSRHVVVARRTAYSNNLGLVLVHEALHFATNQIDSILAGNLGLQFDGTEDGASTAIQTFLESGCPKEEK